MNRQKVKIPNQSPSIRDGTSECWFLFVALLEICSPPWICGLILKSCSQTLKKKKKVLHPPHFCLFPSRNSNHVMSALPTLSPISLSFLCLRLSMCFSCWAAFWRTSLGLASRSPTVSLALIHRHRDSNCYGSFYFQNIILVFWPTDSYFQACLLVLISFSNI